jgi:hypothetical protein
MYTFASMSEQLSGAQNDGNDLESIFRRRGYSVQNMAQQDFNRDEILKVVAEFLASAFAGDVRAIVFAGDSIRLQSNHPPAIVPPTCKPPAVTISVRDWNDNIQRHTKAGVIVLSILSTCFSGGFGEQDVRITDFSRPTEVQDVTSSETPIFVTFSSSASSEEACESAVHLDNEQCRDHFLWALAATARNPQVQTWEVFIRTLSDNFSYTRSMVSTVAEDAGLEWLFSHPRIHSLTDNKVDFRCIMALRYLKYHLTIFLLTCRHQIYSSHQ